MTLLLGAGYVQAGMLAWPTTVPLTVLFEASFPAFSPESPALHSSCSNFRTGVGGPPLRRVGTGSQMRTTTHRTAPACPLRVPSPARSGFRPRSRPRGGGRSAVQAACGGKPLGGGLRRVGVEPTQTSWAPGWRAPPRGCNSDRWPEGPAGAPSTRAPGAATSAAAQLLLASPPGPAQPHRTPVSETRVGTAPTGGELPACLRAAGGGASGFPWPQPRPARACARPPPRCLRSWQVWAGPRRKFPAELGGAATSAGVTAAEASRLRGVWARLREVWARLRGCGHVCSGGWPCLQGCGRLRGCGSRNHCDESDPKDFMEWGAQGGAAKRRQGVHGTVSSGERAGTVMYSVRSTHPADSGRCALRSLSECGEGLTRVWLGFHSNT